MRGEQWLCLLLSPQPSFPPTCAGSGWGQAHPDLLRGGQEHHQRQGKEAWGAQSPQPWHKACTRVRAHPHPAVGGASWKLCPEPAAGGTLGSQGAAASPLWHISCNVAPGEEQTVAGPSSPECGLLDVELLSLSALLTRSPATFLLALISICLPCSVSSPSLCSSPSLSLLLSPPTPFHLCSPSLSLLLSPSLCRSASLWISVYLHNVPPLCLHLQLLYTGKVSEDVPLGHFILKVSATDLDSDTNAQITYSLHGPGADDFKLDPHTGRFPAQYPGSLEEK